MKKNDLVSIENNEIAKSQYVQQPGDKVSQEMMPCGDVVTRLDTQQIKATVRQYMKKDGALGKKTMILMQPDD